MQSKLPYIEGFHQNTTLDRRRFLKTSAALSAIPACFSAAGLFAAGSENIKVALIGCGGRGKGALANFLEAATYLNLKADIVALADYFRQPATDAAGRFGVSEERCFSGAAAYQDVMKTDADIVLLVTPPNFRPLHLEAAVKAGKHAFIEKPIAVDPPGARKVIEIGRLAKQKGLAIVAGTQYRHNQKYIETQYAVSKGAIGTLCGGKVWHCTSGMRVHQRQPGEDDATYMVRNWLNFTEMSGDHIVEQHIHNIDVANWFIGRHPEKALGVGGRMRRKTGNQYDFFSVDFDYGQDVSVHSICRQITGCYRQVAEFFTGTKGSTWGTGPGMKGFSKKIEMPKLDCVSNQYVQEHIDLLKGIIAGKPLNETQNVAESTLTAIMGRISAYTGYLVRWKELTDETTGSPWYSLKLSPAPEEFENGSVKAPPDDTIPLPGRSNS